MSKGLSSHPREQIGVDFSNKNNRIRNIRFINLD
jgi:hypothetical protein